MGDDRLSGLDTSFLHLERDGAHMHVASTTIFEGPAPSHEEFRDHIESRLHLVPRFRQKVRFVPFGQGRPVWVDDPHLNLEYHVRRTALPPPGSEEQLRNLAARIFSQQLDRSKPLWEMWLAEGLEGDRFAIIGKTHHALVDGVSGVDITHVLYDAAREPTGSPDSGPEWLPRPEPNGAKLLADALLERATSPREIVRGARAVLRGPRRIASQLRDGLAATGKMVGAGLSAPRSPLNVEIGGHRRFAWVTSDLGEFKRIKNELGGTVNDVVLAAVTGALARYMRARGFDTNELELRAMVPVSVRADEEHGALGNRVAAIMAPLPVWSEDPVETLHLINDTMGDLKGSGQAVGAEILTGLADFAPPTIASQAARLQSAQRFFNLVVTNIPGPQFPLYVLGREMQALYPMVPLAQKQAVCVGIMSYNGQIHFGLIGDYDAMAHLDSLALDLEAAIDDLSAAAPKRQRRGRARKAPKKVTAPRKTVGTEAAKDGAGAEGGSAKAPTKG
ncbi:MAG: wax ester/triacylglycerol synthase family O-acyltransferase [Actinomycetota bacterium]